jgi:hypothetical protein
MIIEFGRYFIIEVKWDDLRRNVLTPFKNKVVWAIRQLFPLTYRSHYESAGKKMFSVYKMWFGHTYKVENFVLDLEYITQDQKIKTFMGEEPKGRTSSRSQAPEKKLKRRRRK